MKMEKAVYLKNPDSFKTVVDYDRLYTGEEFCEKRLPTVKAVIDAHKTAAASGAGFSLVTPFVSEGGLEKLKTLLGGLPEDGDIEVIVNDYGALMFLREERPDLEPVLGRLLAKQKKGVGISTHKEDAPPALIQEWRHSAFDNRLSREYLKGLGVKRVELDNLVQGVGSDFGGSGLAASIYYPYAVVTVSSVCDTCGSGASKPACFGSIIEDKGELFDRTVYVSGNARFFRNETLPAENGLTALGIDRIIYEPDLPV